MTAGRNWGLPALTDAVYCPQIKRVPACGSGPDGFRRRNPLVAGQNALHLRHAHCPLFYHSKRQPATLFCRNPKVPQRLEPGRNPPTWPGLAFSCPLAFLADVRFAPRRTRRKAPAGLSFAQLPPASAGPVDSVCRPAPAGPLLWPLHRPPGCPRCRPVPLPAGPLGNVRAAFPIAPDWADGSSPPDIGQGGSTAPKQDS